MHNYSLFKNRIPEIILNENGNLFYDNKPQFKVKFEVDYNLFTTQELNKILGTTTLEKATDSKLLTKSFIPTLVENKKKYISILTENTTLNFRLLQYEIEILKDGKKVVTTKRSYSKEFAAVLADGNYIFNVIVYNTKGEKVKNSNLEIKLKTNPYSMNSNKTGSNIIVFDKNEGDFSLEISPRSNKYYTFTLDNIHSDNEDIFYFNYWNKKNTSKMQRGAIGSEFAILNQKQIDEYEKHPELVNEIEGDFVFNIKKVLTGELKPTTLGAIRFPTVLEKLKDNSKKYCNLKCDVSQNYQSSQIFDDNLLITDKFKTGPLFYKFIINSSFDKIDIKDSEGEKVSNFKIEKINDNISVIYFNPLRSRTYYLSIDDSPYQIISYKKSWEPFISKIEADEIETELDVYIENLIIMCDKEIEVDIELTLIDYSKITLNDFKTVTQSVDLKFLPDNCCKISKEIKKIKINNNGNNFTIINMISNSKKLKDKILYYKKIPGEFVYFAEEVQEIILGEIPEKELNKLIIGKKYNFKNNILAECVDGPLHLENIKREDIVFTDIDELFDEAEIFEYNQIIVPDTKDKFYNKNFKRAGAVLCQK